MEQKKYNLFSNGTEFELWTSHNCDRCVKASRYVEERGDYTAYRCAVQKHIDEAYVGDGKGNKRDYDATHSHDCPYRKTERKIYKRKFKKDPNQTELFDKL